MRSPGVVPDVPSRAAIQAGNAVDRLVEQLHVVRVDLRHAEDRRTRGQLMRELGQLQDKLTRARNHLDSITKEA